MNTYVKYAIVLGSEALWLYYTIALFTSVEWNEAAFVHAAWWVVAAFSGYIITALLIHRIHYIAVLIGNIVMLTFIIVKNWHLVVPANALLFGIISSIALLFIFIRSASFVFKDPNRKNMIRRFEGNVVFYILFATVFSIKEWHTAYFHPLFLVAIVVSLIGIVFTLHHEEKDEENDVHIQVVGQARSFTTSFFIFIISVLLVSALLFLPSVSSTLRFAAEKGLSGLTTTLAFIGKGITWLLTLFSPSKTEGSLIGAPPATVLEPSEQIEETFFTIPLEWLFGSVAVIILIVSIWMGAIFLRKYKRPERVKKKRRQSERSWSLLWKNFAAFLEKIKKKWRTRFKRYYINPVFWYYYKVERWGEKNGYKRLPTETVQEYVEKIIIGIEKTEEEYTVLVSTLRKLSESYYATYYGKQEDVCTKKFTQLLHKLKKIEKNSIVNDGKRIDHIS